MYGFLVRAGATLPERTAVDRLSALTGVRWIVVHLDRLSDDDRDTWAAAQMHGPLAPAWQGDGAVIYEVVGWERGGAEAQRLTTTKRFATTIGGLPRAPLSLDAGAGSLSAPPSRHHPPLPGRLGEPDRARPYPQHTDVAWPGMDPDPNGLVHVRYSLSGESDEVVLEGTAALDDDVPGKGALLTNVSVQGNLEPGRLGIRFELVQLVDGRWASIGVAPLEGEAEVVPLAPRASLATPPSRASQSRVASLNTRARAPRVSNAQAFFVA
jgi:hypothetical protein